MWGAWVSNGFGLGLVVLTELVQSATLRDMSGMPRCGASLGPCIFRRIGVQKFQQADTITMSESS